MDVQATKDFGSSSIRQSTTSDDDPVAREVTDPNEDANNPAATMVWWQASVIVIVILALVALAIGIIVFIVKRREKRRHLNDEYLLKGKRAKSQSRSQGKATATDSQQSISFSKFSFQGDNQPNDHPASIEIAQPKQGSIDLVQPFKNSTSARGEMVKSAKEKNAKKSRHIYIKAGPK